MAKTDETKAIEKLLIKSCFGSNPKLAKTYGTTEVTVGRAHRKGMEIVDFLSYDGKTFRAYEIKISMNDFKSSAKKSWCGNINYLVLSKALFDQKPLDWWKEQIPANVGIMVADTEGGFLWSERRAMRVRISAEATDDLKDSLIRTLFYKSAT